MRAIKMAMLATAATAALTTATLAADPIMMYDTPAPMAAAVGLDGPYVGLFVLGRSAPAAAGLGVNLGVNFASDGFLFGAEGQIAWVAPAGWDAQLHGKVGIMATDSAAIYVFAGLGSSSANGAYIPLGIGAEVGLTDMVSLKGSLEYDWNIAAGASPVVGKVGVNFHF